MRRKMTFAALFAALAFVSCTNELDDSKVSEEIVKTVVLDASFEEVQIPGRATLGALSNGKMPFLWNTGDQIKGYVNVKALNYASGIVEAYDNSSSAQINVNWTGTEIPGEGDKMLFFFPGQKGDATISAAGVSFTFPQRQYAAKNGLPSDSGYRKLSAAIADAGYAVDVYNGNVNSLKFQNAFAIVQFSLDASFANVKEFAIVGNKNETLTGTYNIAADASVALDGSKTSYKAATLVYDSGANFATNSNYYVVLAPTDFTEGFTVRLTLDSGVVMTKSSPKQLYSFPRSSVNGLGVLKADDFVAQWEPTVTEKLSLISNTSARNIAMDAEYFYVANHDGNSALLQAYPVSGGDVKTMNTDGIAKGAGTHLLSGIDMLGGSLLVSNLAIGQELKLYKWDSVDSGYETVLQYSVPAGTRLGDKFTAYGDWNEGILIFNDYSNKNKAYVFAVESGVVNPVPVVVNYSTTYGQNLAAIYKYSESQYIWAGVASGASQGGQNVQLFNYGTSLTDASSSTALPFVSGTSKSAGTHGLRFFDMYGKGFMAYLQVSDKLNSYLNICRIGSGVSFADAIASATSVYSATIATPGNSGIYGDVAVYSDGFVTYVAALAYGTGITVYEIK